jgi:meiotically up-regulated gene 157 (Mug157) protein
MLQLALKLALTGCYVLLAPVAGKGVQLATSTSMNSTTLTPSNDAAQWALVVITTLLTLAISMYYSNNLPYYRYEARSLSVRSCS